MPPRSSGSGRPWCLCETYQKASQKTGKQPKLYISHIAGIYDDHLKNVVEREKIDISPDVLWQAGLAVARKLYIMMKERGLPGTFIAGGARGLHHFTEMVGGEVCCTINWEGTADKLIEQNPPVVYRLFNPVPQKVIDELMEKLPDFKRGYLDDGLEIEEFEDFGPVRLFRCMFTSSWQRVLAPDQRTPYSERNNLVKVRGTHKHIMAIFVINHCMINET